MTARRVSITIAASVSGTLNMTLLALRFTRFANGVAMQHGKVSREMFPEFAIGEITNGIHAPTWVSAHQLHQLAR